jgi:hypothetical protein
MVGGMAVGLALAVSGRAIAGPLEIQHTGVGCVAVDRYTQIVAAATPADSVARAELQFRIRPDADWYGVPMTADGGSWAAVLPRPGASLTRFEYRIVMTGVDLATAESAPIAVRVAGVAAPCVDGPRSSLAVTAPIVVRVPAGAPVMPPVPPGFSPAGVVAAVQSAPKSGKTAWMVGGAAAVAGSAVAVLASGNSAPTLAQPEFTFFGSRPNPGATLSLRTPLYLNVLPRSNPGVLLSFSWRMEFPSSGPDVGCVVAMSGSIVGAPSTVPMQLSAPLVRSNTCVPPIRVATGRLTIRIEGTVAYDETHELPFVFVEG